MADYKNDKLYCALVEALKVTITENGGEKGSHEYWSVQALITNLRPECSMADPKSPLEPTDDGITQTYGATAA
ncbi:MAG: hypothetical protein LCH74_20165 [Proteobacteria bacterium]|nr:hypothetical protein [Pseudomonadota bacterium]